MKEKGGLRAGRARRIGAVALAVVLGTAGLAACGGDDDQGGGTSGGSGGAAETSTTAAAPRLTGPPIKTMTVASVNWNGSSYPNILATAQLFQKWVNDHGGIHGRPLEVTVCDDQGDPNQTAACGRKALAEDVVAVVGSFALAGDRIAPVLENGDTSWFGIPVAATPAERNNPVTFELGAGLSTSAAGAKQMGRFCKKPASVSSAGPGSDYSVALERGVLASMGVKLAKDVRVPLTAQDFTPQVAEATSGTDCLFLNLGRTQVESFMPPFAQSGGKQRLFSTQGNLNTDIAEKFPQQTQDAIVAGWYPDLSTPAFKDFRDAIARYKPQPQDWEGGGALGTWTGYTAFKAIVDKMTGPIDHATFLAAARQTKDLETGGKTPSLDLTHPWAAGPPSLRRMFNRSVAYVTFKNGQPEPFGPAADDLSQLIIKNVKE
jgi:ABC-type branched-subunit amino acid transport system substrate-binding protein